MERVVKVQLDIQSTITNGHLNFKKSPKSRITSGYISTRLETLEVQWRKFCINHDTIVGEFNDTDREKEKYFACSIYDVVETAYIDYKSELKDALEQLDLQKNATHSYTPLHEGNQTSSSVSVVRLPKIEIPIFSGKYMEWPTFHDLFESLIHKNVTLDNVHKLHYLKSYLSGEAEQLLRHIPITDANYETCWNQLKKRYSNKRHIANCILTRLVSQKTLTAESSNGVKMILDTTSECLNALVNIGVSIDSWDILIIHLIALKLDMETRKQWEQNISDNMDELPTLQEFKRFLESRFRSLEYLDPREEEKTDIRIKEAKHKVFTAVTAEICSFCRQNHLLYQCNEFGKESADSRRDFVQKKRLCYNCFGATHLVTNCRRRTSCQKCGRRHHSLLHDQPKEAWKADNVVDNVLENSPPNNITANFADMPRQPGFVMLATALIKVEHKGFCYMLRALLDQGSQASFITERAVQLLGLRKVSTRGTVSGLGGDKPILSITSLVMVNIQSTRSSFACEAQAYVVNQLTSTLPSGNVNIQDWPEFEGLSLADPDLGHPGKIDMLLGADVYSQILLEGVIKSSPSSLTAQKTELGWIVSGRIACTTNKIINMHIQDNSLNESLRKFWEMESDPPFCDVMSLEDKKCEGIFETTTTRDNEGRYVVKLPFRDEDPICQYGHFRQIALRRFLSLEKRLDRNLKLKEDYSKVMKEYLDLNHMEPIRADDEGKQSNCVYLPHHAVIREDKTTTKVRVVFDASCKGLNGKSLNDDLLTGPRLQQELRHILLRWRFHPICFVADIIKMYRQIKVASEDTKYQCLLWREKATDPIKDYVMSRVTFGVSSAPYLAVKSLQQLAKDEENAYPLAAKRVLTDFYMDDLMSGSQTEDEALEVQSQLEQLLKKGGFELQKWGSNNERLMKKIRGENKERELDIKSNEIVKILGLSWDVIRDEFKYITKLSAQDKPVTKRNVLSDISRLFDPLGWIAPVTVKAKIFMQKLWLAGQTWDQEIHHDLLQEWVKLRADLNILNSVTIPRWVHTTIKNHSFVELHGFCDASEDAFAAVVFLRVTDEEGNIHVNLMMSRTRVAPIKQVSIPRLELCGAELLANLLLETSLVMSIPKSQLYGWTDSTIVLAWLRGQPNRWKTFVANRVTKILAIMDNDHWFHVESSQNPADCASRGMYPMELINHSLWFNGPKWLQKSKIEVPVQEGASSYTNLEEKSIKTHLARSVTSNDAENELCIWKNYSTLRRLTRVIAWCRRFVDKIRFKPKYYPSYITASELNAALIVCLKQSQYSAYKDEIKRMQASKPLAKTSSLYTLCPIVDNDGLMRVSGRIEHSKEAFNVRHPIILPKDHQVSRLVVAESHEKTLHGGPQLMLNYIRSKYWIVTVKNLIRKHIKGCVKCTRYGSQNKKPFMGALPSPRVTISRPFSRSGVDYAGPINVRISKGRGCRCYKGCVCLFVCMVTRAIHLEVVSDLTSAGFLAAFKRFVARRGHCKEVWSDNGTNFVGASKELKQLFDHQKSSVMVEIAEILATFGTEWHFIPPHAPNFGGLWEAGVRSTKFHLRRILDDSTLTFEELSTVLTQIEACLNSRPMYRLPSTNDTEVLTPGHFLVGEPLVTAADRNYENQNITTLRRWQLTQRLMQGFWRKWSKEYLTTLYQRYKWARMQPEPNVGDVVLVREDNLPPSKWLYGVIEEKHPGPDKITRVVTLRCNKSKIKRPVSKLCILPIAE